MSTVILIVLVVLALFIVPALFGNPGFWQLTAKHPDAAYEWFKSERCWVVLDDSADSPPEPQSDFVGPFRHHVPKLGRWVRVYGLADEIEESQRRFRSRLERSRHDQETSAETRYTSRVTQARSESRSGYLQFDPQELEDPVQHGRIVVHMAGALEPTWTERLLEDYPEISAVIQEAGKDTWSVLMQTAGVGAVYVGVNATEMSPELIEQVEEGLAAALNDELDGGRGLLEDYLVYVGKRFQDGVKIEHAVGQWVVDHADPDSKQVISGATVSGIGMVVLRAFSEWWD